MHCLILKYADDTKGLRVVDTEEQAELLQIDLDNLSMWSVEWQMLFNIDKCHILHFGAMNPCREYQINGHPLKHVDYEKDLGVLIDSTCTPSRQVTAAALKGNQALGQLLRAFTYRDRGTYVKLYKQYVRPHLECCVQAWSPWLQKDIELMENVQKRAIKAVSGLSGSYEEKLATLHLQTLVDRRLRGDMIETFKIIKGIDNVDSAKYFVSSASCHQHATRQSAVVTDDGPIASTGLTRRASRTSIRENFFSQRVVPYWNNLPVSVREAVSVDDFKIKYDKHLFEARQDIS